MAKNLIIIFAVIVSLIACVSVGWADSSSASGEESAEIRQGTPTEQKTDTLAQANNPLANMVAFNIQNYYIGKLTESDENAK